MISWVSQYLKRVIPWRALLLIGLILIVQNNLLLSMDVVVRGVTARALRPLLYTALIVGWLLARSRIKPGWAWLLAISGGAAAALGHVGDIFQSLGWLIRDGVRYLYVRLASGEFPSNQAVLDSLHNLVLRSREIFSTLYLWLADLQSGFSAYNQTVILMAWGLLLWLLSVWLVWSLRRMYQPLWGLLPSAFLLSTLLTYTPGHRNLIIYSLGAGLALIGLGFYEGREASWKQAGVANPDLTRKSMTWAVLGISFAVMVGAAVVPSLKVKAISDPIQEWLWEQDDSQGTILRSMGVEYDPGVSTFSVETVAGLPRSHLIGSGPELEKRVVMVVRFPPGTPSVEELPRETRYWRAYTYDQYTGSGWKSSQTVEQVFEPGEPLETYPAEDYLPLTQEIRISNKLRGALYAAGRVETVDRDYQVSWRTTSQEPDQVENRAELVLEDIFAIAMDNIVYQVRSAVPAVSEDRLRESPLDYPEWIEDRYLQLPESVPDRVLELAGDVVASQPTAFDQAKAIETFLRTYPYTLDIPDPVSDRDVADYFLFDLQKGYCDYYATSMVVLARAAGLPARVVVGFVEGRYDEDDDRYLVTEADAHTWPEVYFNGVGWIAFEPTAGRSAIDQDSDPLPVPPELDKPPQTFPEPSRDWGDFFQKAAWYSLPVVLILLGWVAYQLDLGLLRRKDPSAAVKAIYQRLYRLGGWLTLNMEGWLTPYEFEGRLLETVRNRQVRFPRLDQEAEFAERVRFLTRQYVLSLYSPRTLAEKEQLEAVEVWKDIRRKLFWIVVVNRLERWSRTVKNYLPGERDLECSESGDKT
jgi:transglutaminase-like putative cysteine protease